MKTLRVMTGSISVKANRIRLIHQAIRTLLYLNMAVAYRCSDWGFFLVQLNNVISVNLRLRHIFFEKGFYLAFNEFKAHLILIKAC